MRRGIRFTWVLTLLAFACATALGQQGGNGGQGGGGQGGGGQGGTGGQGGGGQGGGQGGMATGTPLIQLEQAPIITAPGSSTGGTVGGSGGADASNIFSRTYGNPYYQGIPANAKSSAPGGFGSALYNTTGGAGGAGGRGGAGGALGGRGLGARGLGGRGLGGAGQDGMIVQQPISISFPAIATFPVTPVATPQLQTDISGMIARTRAITNPAGVAATVENGIVTLTGTVMDAGESKTLASMILLTPGVRGVKNNLTIAKQ